MRERRQVEVLIVTRWPWFLLYGGCEIQAAKYVAHATAPDVNVRLADEYQLEIDADIIHFVGTSQSTIEALRMARARGLSTVLSPVYYTTPHKELFLAGLLRMPYVSRFFAAALYQRAFCSADLLLPNSRAEVRQLQRIFGVQPDRTVVLHNGVDEPDPDVKSDAFARTFGVEGSYVLCVSMIDPRKNTIGLIRGFLEAGLPQTQLVLVGGWRTGNSDYHAQVEALCRRNSDKVRIVGFVSDRKLLASAYKGACMHALPSFFETPGLSSLEALTYGCNIVVGDCEPVREYFGDLPFYCNASSAQSIAAALFASFSQHRGAAAAALSRRFYWSTIGDELANLYRRLAESRS